MANHSEYSETIETFRRHDLHNVASLVLDLLQDSMHKEETMELRTRLCLSDIFPEADIPRGCMSIGWNKVPALQALQRIAVSLPCPPCPSPDRRAQLEQFDRMCALWVELRSERRSKKPEPASPERVAPVDIGTIFPELARET